ncbi:MAG TPA: HemK/PrmC family methyltransferase [Acidimicrobiales bacterium]|nr:HemK/PrmC family methyltransferase [Acidimicrobiales bacterium]
MTEAAGGDPHRLDGSVRRREEGEPVEWIVGWAPFCGIRVGLRPGVFVPRAQTEVLARAAAALVGPGSVAVDLATGSGAIGLVLLAAGADVSATELDPTAVGCARANGLTVHQGDLDAPLPADLEGRADVLTANVPYVPTAALPRLPRDVLTHEPRLALDGGADGLDVVRRVLAVAPRWLRRGGSVLVEVGPDQAGAAPAGARLHRDAEGDVRCLELRV